jgi:two-component system phosphate regulon sensor histidine kinase PhoR
MTLDVRLLTAFSYPRLEIARRLISRVKYSLPMKIPFVHNTLVIFVAIGLIVISTAALSFYSYRYTVGRENLFETSLVQSNIRLVLNDIDRIEQKIIDNDRILLEMMDVDDSENWAAMDEEIKNADLNVDQVYILRPESNYPIYPPYSFDIRIPWGGFRTSFDVKELDLDNLIPDQPYHLHKERSNRYFFATYMIRATDDGSRILVCYQMNYDKIIALLDRHLRDLQERFYVSIVDFENNGIYGQPVDRSSQFFFETRFPTTLYKWILQIVPRNYAELEQGIADQRRTNLIFIILSMSLTFISLAIIYVAWRRDRQLRKLKEDFIGNVSHELKTPLSLIRMFSEILVTGRIGREEKKREYYQIIHSESDRMSRLINNLLDFANLGQGIGRKNFEKTNIVQLVTDSLEAYRYEVQKDGFQLNLKTDSDIPDSFADPNAIAMAFLNMLDNSVKYSGGQKQIEVRVGRNNGFVDLSVTDKGIGIPLSEQQKIFDKFYRGKEPAIRRIRGSGIGLSITKNVAEMHGGEVLVQSEPGKGSTFTMRIPIRTTPEA